MHQVNAIIADDERHLCTHLESVLQTLWPELRVLGTAHSGPEALSLIKQEEPDIAFLDIKMPGFDGIKVARLAQGLCHVVFITAYDEFAVDAFDREAIDYLLKPVNETRLADTIRKLKNRLASPDPNQSDWAQLLSRLSTELKNSKQARYLQWIRAGKGDTTHLIPIDDVIYFRASDKYTSVYTRDDEYLIRKSIKQLVCELDPNQFWQINRGIIVNANSIANVKRHLSSRLELQLRGRKEILIASKKYGHLFKQM